MPSSLALVTAVFGDYDVVKPAPPGFDEYVLVSDRRSRPWSRRIKGWDVVEIPKTRLDPRRAAKVPKCRPDWFTHSDASVWVDGSVSIRDERFAQVARSQLANCDLVVSEHPANQYDPTRSRHDALDEARHCMAIGKAATPILLEQAKHYMASGLPRRSGLFALAVIGRRHSEANRELGSEWLLEMERWTLRDQISFPFLLWQRSIRPCLWPFIVSKKNTEYLRVMNHGRPQKWLSKRK